VHHVDYLATTGQAAGSGGSGGGGGGGGPSEAAVVPNVVVKLPPAATLAQENTPGLHLARVGIIIVGATLVGAGEPQFLPLPGRRGRKPKHKLAAIGAVLIVLGLLSLIATG
jgi:hypothetical protein